MNVTKAGEPVLWSIDGRGVGVIVLNRPAVNNAYDAGLIAGLAAAVQGLAAASGLRAIVVRGNGRHFQAGADLRWLDAVRRSSPERNLEASRSTAEAIRQLNRVAVPTLALVQGACFGGGTGLIAACDIVIAADDAVFSIAEARWGLTAAIILPQLCDAISVRQVRRYAMTGERFDAAEAHRIGLVHEVVPLAELDAAGERMLGHLLENAPDALAQTKTLALRCAWGDPDDATFAAFVESHALKRQSAEAAEGLTAFTARRPPRWSAAKST